MASSESAALQRVHDRLSVTSNEELPKILARLLPGLLPLSDKDELRPKVLTIVSMISRRVKSLSIPLPCSVLIEKIVRPEMMPFSCNIALSLIDISLQNIDAGERMDCALAILNAIQLFGPTFSIQTNALLNYSLQLLPEISKCFNNSFLSSPTREHVWAWLLDITLVQPGLKKDAAGSIQPGLSAERVARLTAKTEGWFLPHLSELKLKILNTMSPSWMNFKYIAAIVMVCVCDSDVEVSKQAVYKLNGLKSSINNPPPITPANASAAEVVAFLLRLCMIGSDSTLSQISVTPDSECDNASLLHRIQIRVEVRITALRWIRNEAAECVVLPTVRKYALGVIKRVFATSHEGSSTTASLGSTSRYQAVVMEIADVLSTAFPSSPGPLLLDDSSHVHQDVDSSEASERGQEGVELAKCCLVALSKYLVSSSSVLAGTAGALGSFHEDDNMSIRKSAYSCLGRICRAFPQHLLATDSVLTCAVPLVSALFRLMEWEHDANLSQLLAALGSLRIAFRENYQHANAAGMVTTRDNLTTLIITARCATFPKKRVVALHWARALFGWQGCVIDTMLILAGDSDVSTRDSASNEFKQLRESIGKDSCVTDMDLPSLFVGLMRVRELYNLTMMSTEDTSETRVNVLKEVFRTATAVLQAIYPPCRKVDESPFVGPSRWTAVRFGVSSQDVSSNPDLTALTSSGNGIMSMLSLISSEGMQNLLTSSKLVPIVVKQGAHAVVESRMSVVDEIILISRNCILLGNHECIKLGREMLPIYLQWLRHASSSSFKLIGQTIGVLAMRSTEEDARDADSFVESVWRVLQHKTREEGGKNSVGAISCMTAVLEGLVCDAHVATRAFDAKKESRVIEMSSVFVLTLLDMLQTSATTGDTSLKICALESLGILGSRGFFGAVSASPSADAFTSLDSHLSCSAEFAAMLQVAVCSCMSTQSPDASVSLAGRVLGLCEVALLDTANSGKLSTRTTEESKSNHRESARKDIALMCAALDTISKVLSAAFLPADIFQRTWDMLIFSKHLQNIEDIMFRYHLAECFVRIAVVNNHQISSIGLRNGYGREMSLYMPLICDLIDMCEQSVTEPSTTERERSFASIVLLVLLKQCQDVGEGKFGPAVHYSAIKNLFTAAVLSRIAIVFLLVIRGPTVKTGATSQQEPFAQDVCCAGLCRVYNISLGVDSPDISESEGGSRGMSQVGDSAVNKKTVSEKIASLVISTLCREKKAIQAAGVAVAGESTDTSSAGDRARAFERAMESGRVQVPISPLGGGANTSIGSDVLAAAAATAAAELNIYTDVTAAEGEQGANARPASDAPAQGHYGVYTKVCKVAKKAGDASLVFAVLSLIRRDPSFGCTGSDTEAIYITYKPPIAKIDKNKTKALLPMLYQARFDPTSAIRDVMRSLWTILIPSETESSMLRGHESEIIKYLANSLSSPQWRDREASCLALESFIPQRTWTKIRPYLEVLWEGGMRVLDDVRDSTRLAAVGFMKVLSSQVVTACNPDGGASNSLNPTSRQTTLSDATNFIIPFLLDKGLLAPSAEGKGFSIGLLLRIVKTSKSSLQAHLIQLIAVLVEAMSAMEPQTLQYMQFHTERLQISSEELESTRLKLSQQSPLQDALDLCLDSLVAPNCVDMIPEVVLNLTSQTKSGVGLATRTAAVRSLVFIINSDAHEAMSQSISQRCFRSLISSVVPNPPASPSLKKELMAALGMLSKISTSEFLTEMVTSLVTIYRKSGADGVDLVITVAECIYQIISKAGDMLQEETSMWHDVICCSFLGTFEEHNEAKLSWEKVFSTAVIQSTHGTKEAAIKAVLGDVFKTIVSTLQSQSWIKRTQAVAVLADLLTFIPSGLMAPNTAEVVVSLLRVVPGQMWKGKESVLRVLASLVGKCPQCLGADEGDDVLLRVMPVHPAGVRDGGKSASVGDQQEAIVMVNLSDMSSRSLLVENLSARLASYHKLPLSASSNYVEPDTAVIPTSMPELSFPKCSAWRLSWIGLITLFLQESLRSDRQYRLAAASALSALPWQTMKSSAAVRSILSLFPTILDMAGLPSVLTGVERIIDQAESKNWGDGANSGSIRNHMESGKVVRKSNYDMFGGRYGGTDPFSSSQRLKARVAKRARLNCVGDGTSGVNTEILESGGQSEEEGAIGVGPNIMCEETVEQVDYMTMTESTPPIIQDNQDNEVNDETESPGLEMKGVDDVVLMTEEGGVVVGRGQFQAVTSDAAFRVKFLETAAGMWPSYETCVVLANEEKGDPKTSLLFTNLDFMRIMPDLLVEWALLVVKHEVWSIRKATLVLLQALVSSDWTLSTVGQSLILQIISFSLDDNKYSQVRAAAAALLLKLLVASSEEGLFLYKMAWSTNDKFKTVVGSIVSMMSLDTNPTVISCYSSIQKEWAKKGM